MSNYYSSIFNEVFGPIMIGTSSSHTAGPYRIGYMSRNLLGEEVKDARISFDPGSSYASYYQLQWSDRGFIAGLFGGRIDSEDTTNAFKIAAQRGMNVEFVKEPKENKHANYGLLELTGVDGEKMVIDSVSLGGAAIELIGIDGYKISSLGDFNILLIYAEPSLSKGSLVDQLADVLTEKYSISECAPVSADASIALYQIDTRQFVTEDELKSIKAIDGIVKVRYSEHVMPVMSRFDYDGIPFNSAATALEYAESENISAGELGIRYEMARSGYSRDEVMDMMKNVVRVMRDSAERALNNKSKELLGSLYEIKSGRMHEAFRSNTVSNAPLGVLNELNCIAIGILEEIEMENPKLVVASPTIGSVGILPAGVVHLGDLLGKTDDEIATAMFAAGSVGTFVAHLGCFGGEVAGCQAECGSAGAMAAAGVVEMLGGTAEQAYTSASICLQNILGLICDSVSIGYEPCNARNALAVSNALSTANLVMAGFTVKIPLDETIGAMVKVGSQLPPCLKGTFGGLCDTPTGIKIAEICG